MADVACVECGQPADPHSPADEDNGVDAGQRCWRHWLSDPADVKPSHFCVERWAGQRLVAYLAAVVGGCAG